MKRKLILILLTCILAISLSSSLQAATAKKPIILVHGIGGSKLWEDLWIGYDYLWFDLNQTMTSGSDNFLDPIKLSSYGNIIDWDVKTLRDYGYSDYIDEGLTEGIISKISIPFMDDMIIFSELITHLENNGYQLGVNLFAFPYDWRRDINEIYYLLDEVVELAKQRSGWSKVDLVAHSMGGLVAKRYLLASSYYRSKVDTFISLGTPYYGSPDAAWALTVGDNFAFEVLGINLGVSDDKVKELVKDFPSNYQLFPSKMYYDQVVNYSNGAYYTWDGIRYNSYFVENGYDFDLNYTYYSHLTHAQVGNAVANRYNGNLYSRNAALHDRIDGVSVKDLGVKHYTVANKNLPTLYVMRTSGSSSFEGYRFGNGDGTVPYFSAQDWASSVNTRYYVNDTDHQYLPSSPAVRNLIVSLLNPTTVSSVSTNTITSTPTLTSTSTEPTTVATTSEVMVDTYADNQQPHELNGILMLIRADQMPLIYKKNDPQAKIGEMKLDKEKIKAKDQVGTVIPENIFKNTIKKGSYIRKFGDIFVVYLPDKEDYVVKFNGKDKEKIGIQIREFTNSKEDKLATIEEMLLDNPNAELEFDLKNKKLKRNK